MVYEIQKGDSLSKIGRKFGVSWKLIYKQNRSVIGDNPNLIYPGQKITIDNSIKTFKVPFAPKKKKVVPLWKKLILPGLIIGFGIIAGRRK